MRGVRLRALLVGVDIDSVCRGALDALRSIGAVWTRSGFPVQQQYALSARLERPASASAGNGRFVLAHLAFDHVGIARWRSPSRHDRGARAFSRVRKRAGIQMDTCA